QTTPYPGVHGFSSRVPLREGFGRPDARTRPDVGQTATRVWGGLSRLIGTKRAARGAPAGGQGRITRAVQAARGGAVRGRARLAGRVGSPVPCRPRGVGQSGEVPGCWPGATAGRGVVGRPARCGPEP